MKAKVFVIAVLFAALILIQLVSAQTQPPAIHEMEDKSTMVVLENGDAQVEEVITLSAAAYSVFKQRFPMLNMYARLFKPTNIPIQIENLNIDVDEANHKITVTYTIKGASVNKGDHWEMTVAPEDQKVTLSAQSGSSLVFTFVGQVTQQFRQIVTVTTNLPTDAENIRFDADTNKISYELPQKKAATTIGGNPVFLAAAAICLALAALNQFLAKRKSRMRA
ncbi:MAG: hypothetical protein ACTSUS_03405 [Candidatus Freyarchaeota archaeon]